MARGRLLISDGIPFTAPSYGLLSTATELDLTDTHWRMGLEWEPLCPETDGTYDPCVSVVSGGVLDAPPVPAPAPAPKEETTEWQIRGATPFTAYSQIDCSPVGQWDDLSDRNRQALIRSEVSFVENTFWTGTPGTSGAEVVFPHLAASLPVSDGNVLLQPDADQVTGAPQEIVIGLGMLEAAMRDCYPGTATIHMPIRLATLAAEHHLIAPRAGGMFTTTIGSKVVIGDYPGTAPDGSTPTFGTTWMYATGEVFYAREPTPHSFTNIESFNRDVNTLSVIAERTYVIGWDCCLIGVPILNGELLP